LRLVGADICTDLAFDGAQLQAKKGCSSADETKVPSTADPDGRPVLDGAEQRPASDSANKRAPLIMADGLRVEGSMFCRPDGRDNQFEADGELRLIRAHIGQDLSFKGAKLRTEYGRALNARALRVDGDMLCSTYEDPPYAFEAAGELQLVF
jgi:hypothetical protein